MATPLHVHPGACLGRSDVARRVTCYLGRRSPWPLAWQLQCAWGNAWHAYVPRPHHPPVAEEGLHSQLTPALRRRPTWFAVDSVRRVQACHSACPVSRADTERVSIRQELPLIILLVARLPRLTPDE